MSEGLGMAGGTAEITETLIELADTLVSDYELLDYLDLLLERSTSVLAAAAGGVMLTKHGEEHEGLQLVACTDEATRMLELFELQRQEGPCVDSHLQGVRVVAEDLGSSTRWPHFTPVALEHGFHAVYAFPMRLRGSTIGALNLFRRKQEPVPPAKVSAAQAFADMATIGIMQNRAVAEARVLSEQLQVALHSRVVIEQAKGMLAERLTCELDEAYQLIRWHARDHNLRLRAVAAAVVAGALDPEEFTGPSPGAE